MMGSVAVLAIEPPAGPVPQPIAVKSEYENVARVGADDRIPRYRGIESDEPTAMAERQRKQIDIGDFLGHATSRAKPTLA